MIFLCPQFVLVAILVASVSASGGYSSFSYGVSDPNTGDIKDQQENRVGGNVVGKYSLLEADGTKRIVEYSANDATGFKAVVHKEPVGALGAATIGSAHIHPAHLNHLGGAGAIANPIPHHAAPLTAVSSLNHHAAQIAAASPLSHGATLAGAHAAHAAAAQAAASQAAAAQATAAQSATAEAIKIAHANKVAHAAHTAAPLTHAGGLSSIGQLAHSAPLASGVPVAHAAPLAPLAAASRLSHGLFGNNVAVNAGGIAGHPSSLYTGYGNPLAGSLDYANRGAPTVSSYSHTIVHNGPDAFPNGGAYGRYGAYGYGGLGPQGTGLAGSPLIHNNPWASGAALSQSNPWASSAALGQSNPWAPRAALSHGAVASPLAAEHGSRLGW